MKWSNSITFQQPLADVRLAGRVPNQNPQERLQERERAAYDQGRRDAEQAMGEKLSQLRNEMSELQNGVVNSIKEMLPQLAHEMESALIEIALESAKKITSGMNIDAKMVENVVREALTEVKDTSEISIQLNPDDLALLSKEKSSLLEDLPETGSLRFTGSTEVTRGGCIIQTRFGLVDAQPETKLKQLRKAVNA